MKPFPRSDCHKPFPNPPTYRHLVANALAILRADIKSASTTGLRHLAIQRSFRIEKRYLTPR